MGTKTRGEKFMEKSRICNYGCVILMGVLLILHFIPFWNIGGHNLSIQNYVWFIYKYPEVESFFIAQNGAFSVNVFVLMPILVLVLTILGIIFCIKIDDEYSTTLLPLACGLVGIWGYLSRPEFQLGNAWGLHLAVRILMVIAAVCKMIFLAKND